MSALRIPTLAMKTLIAPTMTVLMSVFVSWDSLEMEQFVKVLEWEYHYSLVVDICTYWRQGLTESSCHIGKSNSVLTAVRVKNAFTWNGAIFTDIPRLF